MNVICGLRAGTPAAKFTTPKAARSLLRLQAAAALPTSARPRQRLERALQFCAVPRNFLRLHTVEGLWQESLRRSMATSFSDAADGIE